MSARSRRPLYGWLTAEAVSLTGTRVSTVAIPLFVLSTTGSATRTGVVALAEMLPLVLVKLLGGPLIDRLGARRVAITCDLASVPMVALAPVLYAAGLLHFWLFVVLVAGCGALRGPGDGAKNALVPQVVAAAAVPMERATGLAGTVERTASMLGAGAAGLLVAAIGPAQALLVDAASFGLSAAVLAWATSGLVAPQPDGDRDGGAGVADRTPYARQLRQGWDFLRSDRVLMAIAGMVALTNMIDAAWSQVLLPVWSVRDQGGAEVLGLVFATFSGASALGALLAAVYAARLPRYWTYLVAFLLAGLPRFAVTAIDSPLLAVLAVFVAGGFASGFLNPVLGAVEFERIPAHLVGRVTSLMTALCWGLMPFGALLGGLLVSSWGLAATLLVAGLVYFAVTMLPAVDPAFRELDRRPGQTLDVEPARL